jgi:isoamylase
MSEVWKQREGSPAPLGATWIAEDSAYNFAVFASHAKALQLRLYRSADDEVPFLIVDFDPFTNKSDDIWHCRVKAADAEACSCYAYRTLQADPEAVGEGRLFPSGKELLDPYATRITLSSRFDRQAAIVPGANAGRTILAQLPPRYEAKFDWGSDKRPAHEADLVIYEMHVRGFTRNPNSEVESSLAGRYLGVIEKIPYLTELGITAVELMPVFQFEPDCENYWGYMPIGFLTPHCFFAGTAATAVNEFRTMVKALHAANIEVILDVVYNHTAEAGIDGPCYGMKGLDNLSYYLTDGSPPHRYLDFSGTGNTLQSSRRSVRRMVLDSLRYWVKVMHVDGFRFDLASVFQEMKMARSIWAIRRSLRRWLLIRNWLACG